MTLNEIESTLMQADSGDSLMLHEMLIKLLEVVREQQHKINRLLEAVPSAGYFVVPTHVVDDFKRSAQASGDPRDDEVLGRGFRG